MITASRLLAMSHGADEPGEHRCYFCGAPCSDRGDAKHYIKDTFTGFNSVAAPGSEYICQGCVLAMRSECVVDMIDGSKFTVVRGGMRLFSWVLTPGKCLGASKAHMAELRAVCLDPPGPPYSIVLSDSGQTHQIYRGVVGRSTSAASLTLETERIDYRPDELEIALTLTGRLAACVGKPGLAAPKLSVPLAAKVLERYSDGERLIDQWAACGRTPLYRLAAWLTPKKEDCERAYPSDLD